MLAVWYMSYSHIIYGNCVLYETMAQINKFSAPCASPVLHHLYGGLVVTPDRKCAGTVNVRRRHQFVDQIFIMNGVGQ